MKEAPTSTFESVFYFHDRNLSVRADVQSVKLPWTQRPLGFSVCRFESGGLQEERENKPVTQQHDLKSPMCIFLCGESRGHRAWCCWRGASVRSYSETGSGLFMLLRPGWVVKSSTLLDGPAGSLWKHFSSPQTKHSWDWSGGRPASPKQDGKLQKKKQRKLFALEPMRRRDARFNMLMDRSVLWTLLRYMLFFLQPCT